MANVLKMAKDASSGGAERLGWPLRSTARELGIQRDTVSRYVAEAGAEPANPTAGTSGPEGRCEPLCNRSTIMTSNRPLEDWGKLIGDVPAATAILDRFLHHAEVIAITGRSYRLKDQAVKKEPCEVEKETVK